MIFIYLSNIENHNRAMEDDDQGVVVQRSHKNLEPLFNTKWFVTGDYLFSGKCELCVLCLYDSAVENARLLELNLVLKCKGCA